MPKILVTPRSVTRNGHPALRSPEMAVANHHPEQNSPTGSDPQHYRQAKPGPATGTGESLTRILTKQVLLYFMTD